jgi:hypothetical protein
MKIKILEPCTTPAGQHQPGETIETEQRFADYLIAGGYAKPAGKGGAETATAPTEENETASIETAKPGRPKGR